jgi:hypothetical protein
MVAGLTFYTTDPAKWGDGKGSALTKVEEDTNKWTLHSRIKEMEDNPPEPISIATIDVVGSQFTVNLTNGDTLGPYTLPIATFELEGEYQAGMTYHELDVISVPNRGLYLVRIEHVAAAEFDPDADDGAGHPLYLLLFGEDEYIYDIGFFVPGKPGTGIEDGDAIAGFTFDRNVALLSPLAGSQARLRTACAAAMEFTLQKNGTDIGTVEFNLGSTTGNFTFADDVGFVAGDTLTVQKPEDGVDATAKQLTITIKGTRLFE